MYTAEYASPLGPLGLIADDLGLTGLYFKQPRLDDPPPRSASAALQAELVDADEVSDLSAHPVLRETVRWLDLYFNGTAPGLTPALHLHGTPFQLEVWALLQTIPFGQVTSYGSIAQLLAKRRGIQRMAAQAVGGAVGHNPIPIIVPCHRVVGKNGELTGYAGGTALKAQLLQLEHADTAVLYQPRAAA